MNMCARFNIKPPKWLRKVRLEGTDVYGNRKKLSIARSIFTLTRLWLKSKMGGHGSH